MGNTKATAKIVAIYTRVSTTEQAASGLGLTVQAEKCAAYLTATGLVPAGAEVRVFTDAGLSASSVERPALQELLSLVKSKKVAAVVVLKIDRLSRSLRDLLDLVELFNGRAVAFHAVNERIDTGSPAGRMMLSLLGTFAEFEREQIRERTRAAVAVKRSQGRAHGFTPLGSQAVAGRLQAVAAEVEAIDLMVQRRAQGASLRAIASELATKGYATKKGGEWRACTVDVVLRRVERDRREVAA